MDEFLRSYGLWIVLAGVFLLMYRFGTGGCCGRRRAPGEDVRRETKTDAKPPARSTRGAGCH